MIQRLKGSSGRSRRGPKGSARARDLRSLQHQTLSPGAREAIEAELWMRSLLAGLPPFRRRGPAWATKDRIHDEALAWFLRAHARTPPRSYPARRAGDEDVTFWLDSRLLERARRMALRDGVKVARLIDAAFSGYVHMHLPQERLDFLQRVREQAAELYLRRR